MADPKLKLGNDIWATKQKSLLAYNDEGGNFKSLPFQVDRISGGTYVGRNGLVQYAASNEPRIDFTSNTKGALLLEPQRTNNLLRSEEFDNSAWTKFSAGTGIAPVVTANYTTAPDGSNNADRVVFDKGAGTGGSDLSQMRQIVTNVGQGVSSVYIKSNTSDSYTMGIDPVGNVTLITVTPEWQRFTYSETTNDRLAIGLRGSQTSNYADVSVWGAQMEAGTYATSIIPTSSAAVTRVVDTCNITSLQTTIMNDAVEGTLFVDLEFERETNGDVMQWRSSTSNSGRAYFYNTQMGFADTYGANGVVIYGLTENSTIKAAFRLNSLSNATVFLNGVKGNTGNGNTWGDIGQLIFNATYWKMKINEIKMYNTALSDSELQSLTS